MNQAADQRLSAVHTAELHDALERSLGEHFRQPCVVRLTRRPFANTSSFAIEELEVALDNGTSLTMLFKDLSRAGLMAGAQDAKPRFLYNPLREIETYRKILMPAGLGAAIYYGSVVQPEWDRYWLFLEKVRGIELYQEGDIAIWRQVAAWLAGLHLRFAGQAGRLLDEVPLLVYDRNYYRLWMGRAHDMVANLRGGADHAARALAKLASNCDPLIDRLLSLPITLLHGEFYASNVLVEKTELGLRICPVDWEMAALGPGLTDLAALIAGKWPESSKAEMAQAYFEAQTQSGSATLSWEEWLVALDCCRLHQAIQWLGWSSTWSPPPTQTQDWLGEALRLAAKLTG
jgi:hypothetical protein